MSDHDYVPTVNGLIFGAEKTGFIRTMADLVEGVSGEFLF